MQSLYSVLTSPALHIMYYILDDSELKIKMFNMKRAHEADRQFQECCCVDDSWLVINFKIWQFTVTVARLSSKTLVNNIPPAWKGLVNLSIKLILSNLN